MFNGIRHIIDSASSQGYKSNVVKPLIAIIVIMFLASIIPFYFQHYTAGFALLGLSMLFCVAYLVAYFYCLTKNPDLLRSEKYILEKTAIDKIQFVGDSKIGKVQLPEKDFVVIESRPSDRNLSEGVSE